MYKSVVAIIWHDVDIFFTYLEYVQTILGALVGAGRNYLDQDHRSRILSCHSK